MPPTKKIQPTRRNSTKVDDLEDSKIGSSLSTFVEKIKLNKGKIFAISALILSGVVFVFQGLISPYLEARGEEIRDILMGKSVKATVRWHLGEKDQTLNVDAGDGVIELEPGETFKLLQFYFVGHLMTNLDPDAQQIYGLDPVEVRSKAAKLLGENADPTALVNRRLLLPIGVRVENTLDSPVTLRKYKIVFPFIYTTEENKHEDVFTDVESDTNFTVPAGGVIDFGDNYRWHFSVPIEYLLLPIAAGSLPKGDSIEPAITETQLIDFLRVAKCQGIDFTKPAELILETVDGKEIKSHFSLEPLYVEIIKAVQLPIDSLRQSIIREKALEIIEESGKAEKK